MKTYYVLIDDKGYIETWSEINFNNSEEIQSDRSLFGKLGCVKVMNGVADLDLEKEKELINQENEVISFEQLVKENQQLKDNQVIQNSAIADLADIISEIMEG